MKLFITVFVQQFLLSFDDFPLLDKLFLLGFDICLLFVDGVDQNGRQTVILDTFDFAFLVVSYKQRIDRRHVFRPKPDILHSVRLPIESYRL